MAHASSSWFGASAPCSKSTSSTDSTDSRGKDRQKKPQGPSIDYSIDYRSSNCNACRKAKKRCPYTSTSSEDKRLDSVAHDSTATERHDNDYISRPYIGSLRSGVYGVVGENVSLPRNPFVVPLAHTAPSIRSPYCVPLSISAPSLASGETEDSSSLGPGSIYDPALSKDDEVPTSSFAQSLDSINLDPLAFEMEGDKNQDYEALYHSPTRDPLLHGQSPGLKLRETSLFESSFCTEPSYPFAQAQGWSQISPALIGGWKDVSLPTDMDSVWPSRPHQPFFYDDWFLPKDNSQASDLGILSAAPYKSLKNEVMDSGQPVFSASFECEIGDILRQQPGRSIDVLFNHVVIVRSPRGKKKIGEIEPHVYQATTCREYLTSCWGAFGEAILTRVYNAISSSTDSPDGGECGHSKQIVTALEDYNLPPGKAWDSAEPERQAWSLVWLPDSENETLSLHLIAEMEDSAFMRLLEILDFICRVIRKPIDAQGATLLTSTFTRSAVRTKGGRLPEPGLEQQHSLSFTLGRVFPEPPESDSTSPNCWRQLFKGCSILQAEQPLASHVASSRGKGLELSFDLMLALAAITNVMPIDHGVAFFGYSTVLIPERIDEEHNYVQYHLEATQDGQIDPIKKASGRVASITDPSKLLKMRCFLGWTAFAEVLLGSTELSFDIKRSCAKPIQKSVHLKEFSVGLQALYAAIGQVGLTTQATFEFTSHRLMYNPSTDYEDMLLRTAKQVALIVDVEAKRSWLVPKLSLLLHLAHVYIFSHNINTSGVPFVNAHNGPQAVVDALRGKADNVICGVGPSARRLGPLLTDLNRDLSLLRDEKLRTKMSSVIGLELMDIIDRPDRGTYPRKTSAGKYWSPLADHVDVTIVCSRIGSLIKPSLSHRCPRDECNTLPTGRNYLAALNSCLGRLTEETKNDSNTLTIAPGVDIAGGRFLLITGSPFSICQHMLGTADSCWARPDLFQGVQKKDRWPNKRGMLNGCMPSLTLPESGAVVFGEPMMELPSRQQVITVPAGQLQVA